VITDERGASVFEGMAGVSRTRGPAENSPMADIEVTDSEFLFRYRSGGLEVDESRGEVSVDGRIVELEPKPLAVLMALVGQPRQIFSRGELMERLWGRQEHLSHNVLANAVMRLRRALGPEHGALVRNVAGQGYLFDATVERVVATRRFQSQFDLQPGAAVPGRAGYLLAAPLGSSHHSEVWLARHEKTHDRRVFKFASDGERLSALKREFTLFRVLRETLGERDDYARVLDANFAAAPFYLECEYGGESLLRWAERPERLAAMTLDDKLALFIGIARSVADAHRIGVLHKDLKPANVLVAAAPGGWITRIADFGSGRLLSPETLRQLALTQSGLSMSTLGADSDSGTLIYLAPELFAGGAPTLQSDLYALGVMLWQLVAGDLRRPMATGWERGIDDDLLREDIAAATEGLPQARMRSVDELVERLSGLEARRTARRRAHETAARVDATERALARARARRPWLAAALACLAIGLASSVGFYWRERSARVEAEAQQRRAQAIDDFLTLDVLQSADVTDLPPGGTLNVNDLLVRASTRAASRLHAQPETEASVRQTLGHLMQGISNADGAQAQYRQALALLAPTVPAADTRVVSLRFDLSRVLAIQGRLPESLAMLEQAEHDTGPDRLAGDGELAYAGARARFTWLYLKQHYADALPPGRRAITLIDRLHPERLAARFQARRELAGLEFRAGDIDAAAARMKQALTAFTAEGVGEVNYARGEIQLAQIDMAKGGTPATERMLVHARETIARKLGDNDNYVAVADGLLGDFYLAQGRVQEAEAPLRDAHEIFLRRLGPQAQVTIMASLNRSVALLYGGRSREAREQLEAQRAAVVGSAGENAPTVQGIDFFRAVSFSDEGQPRKALPLLAALDADRLSQAQPAVDWPWRLQAERGRALVEDGQRAQGIAELDAGIAGMERAKSPRMFVEPLRRFRAAQPEG